MLRFEPAEGVKIPRTDFVDESDARRWMRANALVNKGPRVTRNPALVLGGEIPNEFVGMLIGVEVSK